MIGIILAGGRGSRLAPLTKHVSKSIILVGDRPMIEYPIKTLVSSGIKRIIVVVGEAFGHQIKDIVSSLNFNDVNFEFTIQKEFLGMPDAIATTEELVAGDNIIVVAGDNIFGGNYSKQIIGFKTGCLSFLRTVDDVSKFAVAEFDDNGQITKVVEKPEGNLSKKAICGPHIFDNRVFEIIKTLKPSQRGELEIVDIYKDYILKNEFQLTEANDFWSDLGTPFSLADVSYKVISNQIKFE